MLLLLFVSSLIFRSTAVSTTTSPYDGYKLFAVNLTSPWQSELLAHLETTASGLDFLHCPHQLPGRCDILVLAEQQPALRTLLDEHDFRYGVMPFELDNEVESRSERMVSGPADVSGRYWSHAEINAYLGQLAELHGDRVRVSQVGTSYEGRPLLAIFITDGQPKRNGSTRKTIMVEGGVHAREWIVPAAALYLIQQLTGNHSTSRELLATFDWLVLPVVNPDGYEHSRTVDVLWRKTRKPGTRCTGVDANRNFGFHWGEAGTTRMECDNSYCGSQPFSEPETQAVRRMMHSMNGTACMYLSLHAYGRDLMFPWSYTKRSARNRRTLEAVANAGARAIWRRTGQRYTVGSAATVMYTASGTSIDYAYAVANIPINIVMEIGDSFFPRQSAIKPLQDEVLVAVQAMATEASHHCYR